MSAEHVLTLGIGLAGAAAVTALTARWWKRRGGDVAASTRAVAVAIAVTALLFPALMLAGAGVAAAQWWVFAVPAAWLVVGAIGVHEQHQARARDEALGAPRRPVLWSPWLVAAIAFVLLEAATVGTLLLWVIVEGDIDTPVVAAVAGAAVSGTFTMAGTQYLRRIRARGGLEGLQQLEETPHTKALALAAGTLGGAAVAAGVLWAATLTFAASDLHTVAMLLATSPGWVLIGAAWVLARPQPPVIDEAPSV